MRYLAESGTPCVFGLRNALFNQIRDAKNSTYLAYYS